jgi:hypothetical protein
MRLVLTALMLAAGTMPAAAQWLDRPWPGIPRTADGKPNLAAPAPRGSDGKPDLSGVWNTAPGSVPIPDPANVLPWVNDLARQRRLDGRVLEADPAPSRMGYSVGRWDGDTLVVESNGYNDKTWLTAFGLSHTEGLRVTERCRRTDFGHLQIEVTYTDPAAYVKPWGFTANMTLAADTEMLEAVCERSSEHWTGTVADAAKTAVTVSPDVLARYVGVYSGLWGRTPRTVEISLSNGQLFATDLAGDPEPLPAQSETLFEGLDVAYQFIVDDTRVATDVVEIHVSGPYRYPRQR